MPFSEKGVAKRHAGIRTSNGRSMIILFVPVI